MPSNVVLSNLTPPPKEEVYALAPCNVALYPLPVVSVHVVPEDGAVAKLNTNPEVTMVGLDPLDGVVVGVIDIVGVTVGVTDMVLVILGVIDTEGVVDVLGVVLGVTLGVIDKEGVTEGLGRITLFNRVILTYPDPVLKYPKLLIEYPLNAEDLSY